jgi:hypothetical protein
LSELGLYLEQRKQPKGTAKPLPSIKDTPLASSIVEAIKKHGKPMDVEGVAKAFEGKSAKSTISNYLARMVNEGVLFRPSRGQFNVR